MLALDGIDTGRILNPPLPPGWRREIDALYFGKWVNEKRGQSVIVSIAEHEDGNEWAHLSIAGRRMPSYDDLCYLKRHWLGAAAKAIMVFPAAENHVNIHPTCLHLFHCLTADPLPEFSSELAPGLRSI